MAQIDERSFLPGERPSTSVPDPALHVNVTPGAFGGSSARGLEQFGQSAMVAGEHWGKIAADDITNQFEETARKIAYGDPTKAITNPDGTQSPDLGFHGLKGAQALNQRAAYEKQLTDARDNARSKLASPNERFQFDQMLRRYANVLSTAMSRHADTEANVYAGQVQQATIKQKRADIVLNANNEEGYKHAAADLIDAHRKQAQIKGATPGDPVWQQAEALGRAEAAAERISTIGANDPLRAERMADEMKGDLGVNYPRVKEHFRARARQQEGRLIGDRVASGAPPPAGDDAKEVLRHFEGFREKPYRDNDGQFRVGYGSDTITKADGTIERVTENTRVTKEDAERDLERRAADSQSHARTAVGGEAFDKLSPQAKASLTSISYNYGPANFPKTVADAAKTGDPQQLAQAIRGLSGHNNGINAGRRASEASNVAGGAGTTEQSYPDQVREIMNMRLEPDAEAAALSRLSHINAAKKNAEVQNKTAFKGRVDDTVAEAINTGTAVNPLSEGDFIRQLGLDGGPAAYADYQADIKYGADRKVLLDMSDQNQRVMLNDRRESIQPGPGYAREVKNQERLEKTVTEIQKQRLEDPAGSVARLPAVQNAQKVYDPKQPETFKTLMDARLEAQKAFGIPPELRSPITKDEALHLLRPFDTALPGAPQMEALKKVGSEFRKMFGDQAPAAFAYAINARRHSTEAMQMASTVLLKLSQGEPITKQDAVDLDAEREGNAQREALYGTLTDRGGSFTGAKGVNRPKAPLRSPGNPEPEQAPGPKADDILKKYGAIPGAQ